MKNSSAEMFSIAITMRCRRGAMPYSVSRNSLASQPPSLPVRNSQLNCFNKSTEQHPANFSCNRFRRTQRRELRQSFSASNSRYRLLIASRPGLTKEGGKLNNPAERLPNRQAFRSSSAGGSSTAVRSCSRLKTFDSDSRLQSKLLKQQGIIKVKKAEVPENLQ